MKKILKTNNCIKNALITADPMLKPIIDRIGDVKIELNLNYFESLVSSIVGQQLSNKVADVIWARLVERLGTIAPDEILKSEDGVLREVGLSYRKIEYIKILSRAVRSRELDVEHLESLDDTEVINTLVQYKGIGAWTAEMFLIFSLGRMDVFSTGDGGLQRAVVMLHNLDSVPNRERLLELSKVWSPYRTFASLYLWRSLGN